MTSTFKLKSEETKRTSKSEFYKFRKLEDMMISWARRHELNTMR